VAINNEVKNTEVMTEEEIKNTEESKNIIDEAPISEDEQAKLIEQIDKEFTLSFDHVQEKRKESLKRLKLYNNQKRDPDKVGDSLLFSVFQTVLAALYDDKLSVEFGGKEEGDDDIAENLTGMAQHDYELMQKDEADYEWIWDTLFFGRGLIMLNEFDRKNMVPVSEIIDPMTFIRDPRAKSINGNQKGYGSARFFGREIELSKWEMKNHPKYFNIAKLKKDKDLKNMTDQAKQARREAQGQNHTREAEEMLGMNYAYNLVEWFTTIRGKKYIVTLANNRQIIVRYQRLDSEVWPVIDRTIFPMSHDWDGVSIPDLIEDKQRARAVMVNLGFDSAKADLYPMYIFDKRKITNPKDLDFQFNKFIPVAGDPTKAAVPLQKSLFHQQVNLILNILDVGAQKAVAAPEIAQGVQPRQSRTLGETQLISASKDVRHSLAARIFGWSEKRYWRQWYWLYKKYFKEEIDEKILRLQGPLSAIQRKLTKDNFISRIDPDIYVESSTNAAQRREKEFQELSTFAQIVIQDPQTNRRYVFRKLGKVLQRTHQELMMMFPPTIDELRSEDENQQLNDNKLPKINALDDDLIHMEIHNKAADTPSKLAHIETHKKMMMFKKMNPGLFPSPEAIPEFKPVGSKARAQETGKKQSAGRSPQQLLPAA